MSKGSKTRPTNKDKYNQNWDRIFNQKKDKKKQGGLVRQGQGVSKIGTIGE